MSSILNVSILFFEAEKMSCGSAIYILPVDVELR